MRSRYAIFAAALLTPALCLSSFAQSRFTVGTPSPAPRQKPTGYLQLPPPLTPAPCFPRFHHPRSPVAPAPAPPGKKATGYPEAPAGVDAATSIPVVVVNGAKPGKILALVSGAHGTEYTSIIAIEKLISA